MSNAIHHSTFSQKTTAFLAKINKMKKNKFLSKIKGKFIQPDVK